MIDASINDFCQESQQQLLGTEAANAIAAKEVIVSLQEQLHQVHICVSDFSSHYVTLLEVKETEAHLQLEKKNL